MVKYHRTWKYFSVVFRRYWLKTNFETTEDYHSYRCWHGSGSWCCCMWSVHLLGGGLRGKMCCSRCCVWGSGSSFCCGVSCRHCHGRFLSNMCSNWSCSCWYCCYRRSCGCNKTWCFFWQYTQMPVITVGLSEMTPESIKLHRELKKIFEHCVFKMTLV